MAYLGYLAIGGGNRRRAAAFAVLSLGTAAGLVGMEPARLRHVTTASQPGPVGYRDPLGVVSPDGRFIAYTSGRHLYMQHVEGGVVRELGPGDLAMLHLAWLPHGTGLAVQGRPRGEAQPLWYRYRIADGTREPLFAGRSVNRVAWSADGRAAGVVPVAGGTEVRILGRSEAGDSVVARGPRLDHPAWSPSGPLACLDFDGQRQRVRFPCQDAPAWSEEAYGPMAFSPDGATLYFGSPNAQGTLDLWSRPVAGGAAQRLTYFARDAYAPSVTGNGKVLFKLQDYRTHVALAPAEGGTSVALTTFQSETPSFDPTGTRVAVTYGPWRRVIDDFRYPDIAQEVGIVPVAAAPAAAVSEVVAATSSEDQGMDWSPDGRLIAFHSHFGPSDDIWIRPADGSRPARRITEGGIETGWPRWSPDGRFIAYVTDRKGGHADSVIVRVGMDPRTGEVTEPQAEVPLLGFAGRPLHVEWGGSPDTLVFDAALGGTRRGLFRVARVGGKPEAIHAFWSEQEFSGFGASRDGRFAAFIAPAADGFLQVFRVPLQGGEALQVTRDPTHKTQPAVSPDGRTIAFTVFRYEAQFWVFDPR